ncbi:hypothetical protein CEXT_413571 [Caerostris extrusa]|uniref:Uncharacterized protein n=1 Tax=Caerostris extrusa TaxID=172846 RepID=A0AAV4V9L9_CAEEX|nr:hypothetical protein CEXT_413571 [Caerostris extrusa]
MKVFIFVLLACIAVAHAWLEHDLPAVFHWCPTSLTPMASLHLQLQSEMFNDVALGYRGVLGFNAPLVGFGGVYGLRK